MMRKCILLAREIFTFHLVLFFPNTHFGRNFYDERKLYSVLSDNSLLKMLFGINSDVYFKVVKLCSDGKTFV